MFVKNIVCKCVTLIILVHAQKRTINAVIVCAEHQLTVLI